MQQEIPYFSPEDPKPYTLYNKDGGAPILLVCDHADIAIPASLNKLGLAPEAFNQHVALDIGSASVTKLMAKSLNAKAVLANYSRLVVDCNRQIEDPTIILPVSDSITIPGNQQLSAEHKMWRIKHIFLEYHKAIAQQIATSQKNGIAPAIIAIHSFTPSFDQHHRPWHLGILWDADPRIPVPLLERLRALDDIHVGDNEPYSGKHQADYTIDHHAEAAGLPHVSIEIRQDLIDDEAGSKKWSEILLQALQPILKDKTLYQVLHDY